MKVYVLCMVFLTLVIYGESAVKFLPTIPDDEAVAILMCVSKSCNQKTCDDFKACAQKMAPRVLAQDQKCLTEINASPAMKCDKENTLYPSDDAAKKLFECIGNGLQGELTPQETEEMKKFETCAKEIYKACQGLPKCK